MTSLLKALVALLLVSVAAGCQNPRPETFSIDYQCSDEQTEIMRDVVDAFCEQGDAGCMTEVEYPGGELEVNCKQKYPSRAEGSAMFRIWRASGDPEIWIDVDHPALVHADIFWRAFSHEVGHALGLEHHGVKGQIMYAETVSGPMELDETITCSLFGWCDSASDDNDSDGNSALKDLLPNAHGHVCSGSHEVH